jgi:uncharacterized protein (TIGR02246 family)
MRFIAPLFLLLLVLAGCAAQQQPRDPQAMLAAAKELDDRFLAAFNSGNVDSMAATYWNSPDVVSVPPGGHALRGIEAIRASLPAMFQEAPGAKLEVMDAANRVEGEVVVGSGAWRMSMPGPNGLPMVLNGYYTDVKAERDGRWVYISDHASVAVDSTAAH